MYDLCVIIPIYKVAPVEMEVRSSRKNLRGSFWKRHLFCGSEGNEDG